MNKGINLLGFEKKITINANLKKLKLLRILGVGLLFGISGLSIILFLFIALSPLPALQDEEKAALNRLAVHHPDIAQLFLINDRVKSGEVILSKRTNYNEILTEVRGVMPDDMTVGGLIIKKEEFSITVLSRSLLALDEFLNSLIAKSEEKKHFSKVLLTKLFLNEETKLFNATIVMQTL